jgi:hypothetical protein
MIGADVSFEHLNVSLLGGTIDARGMRVAGAQLDEPLLTVRRLRAEMSVARALRGEIVVKSITIDQPILSIARRADGTTNLPSQIESDAKKNGDGVDADIREAPTSDDPDMTSTRSKDNGRRVDVEKVLVVDGELHFRQDGYHLVAERVMMDLTRRDGGYDVTAILGSVARRDGTPQALGEIRMYGTLDGPEDISALGEASTVINIDAGAALHARVTSPRLVGMTGQAVVDGAVDLSVLVALLPTAIAGVVGGLTGRVTLDGDISFDRDRGLTLPAFKVAVTDLMIPLAT